MTEIPLDPEYLPYPLPPWKHHFTTLSIYCEVPEDRVAPLVPAPLELLGNTVQITAMFFDSTVPTRPYYDSAVIAPVRFGGVEGGYWVHGYTSTDQVLSGTREIWGFKMKLADRIAVEETEGRVHGYTERLGKRLIDINLTPSEHRFSPPDTFPRLFLKMLPKADHAAAQVRKVVMMAPETHVTSTVMGDGTIDFEQSSDDPLHRLSPTKILGASLVKGEQTLVWGQELS